MSLSNLLLLSFDAAVKGVQRDAQALLCRTHPALFAQISNKPK